MVGNNLKKSTGSKGFGCSTQGLARWGKCELAGISAPSSRYCSQWGERGKAGATPLSSYCYRIATWNVRGLNAPGRLANVLQEMSRLEVDILGVAETFLEGEGDFMTEIPECHDKFRVVYSGGNKRRKGVAIITRNIAMKSIKSYQMISDRAMVTKINSTPICLTIVQAYSPCEDSEEVEKDSFYEMLDSVIKEFKKGRECLIVMGDFNAKVGEAKEEDIVGPFGLGTRNQNGQYLVDFCRRHNLHVTNTWFEQKRTARHTWISPDGNTKNQIDYILIDKRFRNGVTNSKAAQSADCDSDHKPVITTMGIRLKCVKASPVLRKWNVSVLQKPDTGERFRVSVEKLLENKKIIECHDVKEIWSQIKACINSVAEEICDTKESRIKQKWMTGDIMRMMEERRRCKLVLTAESQQRYRRLRREIQKSCRKAKNEHFERKCMEIEELDKTHSNLLFQKVKDLQMKRNRCVQQIRDKQGRLLCTKEEGLNRWAEYVEELYEDVDRTAIENDGTLEDYVICEEEVSSIIKKLPKGKSCGSDGIPAEMLQWMGDKGLSAITKLMNRIYSTGYIPDDFRKSIFVPIPKVARAQECGDFRTIALISHASKILLQLIKRRITPGIERQLGENQMGFRKGKGTRDAIFQLRIIGERYRQVGKKLYLCFVDYQKAFDRVRHDKLKEVMKSASVPEIEQRLIENLYWGQEATVRWENEFSRSFSIRKGVRQGCIISPILFNLYSEFMIREALDNLEGVKFGGVNITNLRYADDAVLIAESFRQLQSMMDKLNERCKEYGMSINVKKTKVMILGNSDEEFGEIKLNDTVLERVTKYKYLGSWITEDGRCDEEIKTRIAMAKAAFWQQKEIMRGNIAVETKKRILNCYIFSI